MCDRPNFEETEQDFNTKLKQLWELWRNYYLQFVEKKEMGTITEQMDNFLSDCKERLVDL